MLSGLLGTDQKYIQFHGCTKHILSGRGGEGAEWYGMWQTMLIPIHFQHFILHFIIFMTTFGFQKILMRIDSVVPSNKSDQIPYLFQTFSILKFHTQILLQNTTFTVSLKSKVQGWEMSCYHIITILMLICSPSPPHPIPYQFPPIIFQNIQDIFQNFTRSLSQTSYLYYVAKFIYIMIWKW